MIIKKQTVLDLYNDNQKIQLIKLLRECSGLGLKEAKDAIEAQYYSNNALPKIMELFAPYIYENPHTITNVPYNEMSDEERERTAARKNEINAELKRVNDERKKVILKGMTTACNVWQDLGFNNSLQACQMVLNNLADDSRFTKIQ